MRGLLVSWARQYMMFRGCFRNSFFGSFFESFGVSPSGEFLPGLGMKYPFLFIKTGWGCALLVVVNVFPLSRWEPQLTTPTSFVPGYVCRNGVKNPEWWLRLRVISSHFAEFLNGHFTIRDEDEDRVYVSTTF
jgi:hypothetical protein